MHRTRTGESYVPVGRDDAPSSETERRGGTARYMYEVTGRALDSLQAAASEEWTTGRVTSREELEASTAAMFNRLVRAAFKTCCPDYRLTHVKATASVVYAEIERSGAPNEGEKEIPMGGLTARLVTKDEPDSACCVPRGGGGAAGRLGGMVLESTTSSSSFAISSPRRSASKTELSVLPRQTSSAEDSVEYPCLKNILEIMLNPEEMEFRPVGPEGKPLAGRVPDEIGWLTVEMDEASPRVRQLQTGERFNVLDLRDNGTHIRVRTRHGWFTWGKTGEVCSSETWGKTENGHFRKTSTMKRSDRSYDPKYICRMRALPAGSTASHRPSESDSDKSPMLPEEAVKGSEDAVWIDLARMSEEVRGVGDRRAPDTQRDDVQAWARYPSSQQARWCDMIVGKGADWIKHNREEADRAKAVVGAAQRDLEGLPFFENVPRAYLSRLAQKTATHLLRFDEGETIVQYIGGQSFAQGSLAAEALRPAHDISLALELGLPETICGDVETLQTWAALSNFLQQHRLYGVAGTQECSQETEAKLSEQLETEWSSTAKALHLESESVEKAHERVAAVGECVREFLQLLEQEHTKADSSSGKVAECTAYLIEPFCEAGKDGKQRLLATVLLDVQTAPGADEKESAKNRRFGLDDVHHLFSSPKIVGPLLPAELSQGHVEAEPTYDDFLAMVGLQDKKAELAEYLTEGAELQQLQQMDDEDELDEDILDDLGLDEETKTQFHEKLQALKQAPAADEPMADSDPAAFHIFSCEVSSGHGIGRGMLSHNLYLVHSGAVDVYSQRPTVRTHRAAWDLSSDEAPRALYSVGPGGYFGEVQLMHASDLHGEVRAAKNGTLVWVLSEQRFTQFRGLTMRLLQTVAGRMRFCQQPPPGDSDAEHKGGAVCCDARDGTPCYFDQDQVISLFPPLPTPPPPPLFWPSHGTPPCSTPPPLSAALPSAHVL
eukprot:COSAG03_NODE_568_length_6912_cov_10.332404_1_plen_947_part_10